MSPHKLERELSRRRFMQAAGAATLATMTMAPAKMMPQVSASAPAMTGKGRLNPAKATADNVIFLFMGGGMAHLETFDPKGFTPFEKGMNAQNVRSTFPTIDTAVDHIKFCEGMENIAKVIDRGAVIRSFHADPSLRNFIHIPCQTHLKTGYLPPQTVAMPHIGALVGRILGPKNPDIPAFIDTGRSGGSVLGDIAGEAFSMPGYLGPAYGPLSIPEPNSAMAVLKPRVDPSRFENREKLYAKMIEASPVKELAGEYQQQELVRAMDNAHRLLTSKSVSAFDLSLEPKEVRDKYETGTPFGRGCLLARRLCEAGSRFVEVVVNFAPTSGWDTHQNGHVGVKKVKEIIDRPIAQLILDLEQRGLLERTLVVVATEFGRATMGIGSKTPAIMTEMRHYGMHGHLGTAASMLMFGGGIKRGSIYGKTGDEYPFTTVENPMMIEDLHATIFEALGISPRYHFEIEKRPVYVTRDGEGTPIAELFG